MNKSYATGGKRVNATLWSWTKTRWARSAFTFCRWLHVYLSTWLLALVLFFSFTGIMLNHLSWFDHKGPYTEKEEAIPADLLNQIKEPGDPKIGLIETFIRENLGLANPRSIDIDREIGEWVFDFPLPAGYALVTIQPDEGVMLIEHQQGSLLAILNDLHKGRHTGANWSRVIDVSAILMIVMSLTGLFILFQQAKWRISGLAMVASGILIPLLVYLFLTPRMF